jgi:GTP-binding protein
MSAPLPIVAIVGRPNVGKSTLFNRLIGERRAIVLDTPGVTRDRNYGECDWAGRRFTVIDTGGLEFDTEDLMLARVREQAMQAISEADVVLFVADGRDGLTPADREMAALLRRLESDEKEPRRVVFAVNKIDHRKHHGLEAEFFELGIDSIFPISAEHARGLGDLLDAVIEGMPLFGPEEEDDEDGPVRVAIIGRPNAGKSTLINRMLGEDRVIASDVPGTTRDTIDSALEVDGRAYVLVDTAGLRRKRGIKRGSSESYSVMRTLRALERCHVAVHLIDAEDGVTDQDARIAGLADDRGRGLILVVNKWDAIAKDDKTAKRFTDDLHRKLPFVEYAPILYASALTGQRVNRLLPMVDEVRAAQLTRISTGQLNRWLESCTRRHSPPVVRNRPVKLYYATQPGVAPPTIVVSCNDPEGVHFSYRRFLVNRFRESFDVAGTPVKLIFRARGREED